MQVIKIETDEKGCLLKRIVSTKKDVSTSLPRANMVCVDENGEFTSSDSFKYTARVIHYELKLAFNYHSLRHTHATLLKEGGAEIKDIQKRLGHARIETTLQTYVHRTDKMEEQSVEIFENIVKNLSTRV